MRLTTEYWTAKTGESQGWDLGDSHRLDSVSFSINSGFTLVDGMLLFMIIGEVFEILSELI
jgi:hypothetical protein